jgi:hypothetical protein
VRIRDGRDSGSCLVLSLGISGVEPTSIINRLTTIIDRFRFEFTTLTGAS